MEYDYALHVHGTPDRDPYDQGPYDSIEAARAAIEKHVPPGGGWSIWRQARTGQVGSGTCVEEGVRPRE